MKPLSHPKKFLFAIAVILPLLFLPACASTRFAAGDPKNSLPLIEKGLIEEVHSVAVAPFFNDAANWRRMTEKALTVGGLSVVAAEKTDLSTSGPDNRRDALVKLGRSLKTDAVLNGVLLRKKDRGEIILQLISTKDARLLFWQAADFTQEEGPIDPGAQRELLSKMLGPLLANIAKREKPAAPQPPSQRQAVETPPKIDSKPEAEVQPKTDKKPKSDRKHDKGRKPPAPSEEISPM